LWVDRSDGIASGVLFGRGWKFEDAFDVFGVVVVFCVEVLIRLTVAKVGLSLTMSLSNLINLDSEGVLVLSI